MKIPLPFYLFLLLGCTTQTARPVADEKEILRLLATERKAHMERDTELFVSGFSDSLVSVNRGKVSFTPPDTMRKSVNKYFSSVSFVKWDDSAPPIIRFSPDRQLAYAIVQKLVIVSYPTGPGTPVTDTTQYAWASVYRKSGTDWKLEANISTNQ